MGKENVTQEQLNEAISSVVSIMTYVKCIWNNSYLNCGCKGEVKNDHRSKFFNLNNWKAEEAWKNQGFNGIRSRDLRDTGAMLYRLSYEATHWERDQFIEFMSLARSEMTWRIFEIVNFHSDAIFQWQVALRPGSNAVLHMSQKPN